MKITIEIEVSDNHMNNIKGIKELRTIVEDYANKYDIEIYDTLKELERNIESQLEDFTEAVREHVEEISPSLLIKGKN